VSGAVVVVAVSGGVVSGAVVVVVAVGGCVGRWQDAPARTSAAVATSPSARRRVVCTDCPLP
jgi:ferric-dicitrate binding protein FerR (iron transport regulator)